MTMTVNGVAIAYFDVPLKGGSGSLLLDFRYAVVNIGTSNEGIILIYGATGEWNADFTTVLPIITSLKDSFVNTSLPLF